MRIVQTCAKEGFSLYEGIFGGCLIIGLRYSEGAGKLLRVTRRGNVRGWSRFRYVGGNVPVNVSPEHAQIRVEPEILRQSE